MWVMKKQPTQRLQHRKVQNDKLLKIKHNYIIKPMRKPYQASSSGGAHVYAFCS